MLYLVLKSIHIVAATMFFGTGLGSAFFKMAADRAGDTRGILFAQRTIVLADWVFTVPSGIVLPVTGLWMAHLLGLPWTQGWIAWGLSLYVVAGACWVPAAILQIRMREAAAEAVATNSALPAAYFRWTRVWLILGFPAFLAAVVTIYVMVTKHAALAW